jgi:hypothetical protein
LASSSRSVSAKARFSARLGPLTATSTGVGEPKLMTSLTMSAGSNENRTPGISAESRARSLSFRGSTAIPDPGLSATRRIASSGPPVHW